MGNAGSTPVSNKNKITQHDKAILQLKLQRDKLIKCQNQLLVKINSYLQITKQNILNNNKELAKIYLSKIKNLKKMNVNILNQLSNIDSIIDNIEFKLIESEYLNILKISNNSLKSINDQLNLDKIDDLLIENQDNIDLTNEISIKLGSNYLNDEDVENEINALENDLSLNNDIVVNDKLNTIPDIPITKPHSQSQSQPQTEQESDEEQEQRIPLSA